MSHLRNTLADYLTLRRALGYKMDKAERLLGQFTAFAGERGETHIRTETALTWATLPSGAAAIWTSRRLAEVRLFAIPGFTNHHRYLVFCLFLPMDLE